MMSQSDLFPKPNKKTLTFRTPFGFPGCLRIALGLLLRIPSEFSYSRGCFLCPFHWDRLSWPGFSSGIIYSMLLFPKDQRVSCFSLKKGCVYIKIGGFSTSTCVSKKQWAAEGGGNMQCMWL